MEKFMEDVAPLLWPPDKRIGELVVVYLRQTASSLLQSQSFLFVIYIFPFKSFLLIYSILLHRPWWKKL